MVYEAGAPWWVPFTFLGLCLIVMAGQLLLCCSYEQGSEGESDDDIFIVPEEEEEEEEEGEEEENENSVMKKKKKTSLSGPGMSQEEELEEGKRRGHGSVSPSAVATDTPLFSPPPPPPPLFSLSHDKGEMKCSNEDRTREEMRGRGARETDSNSNRNNGENSHHVNSNSDDRYEMMNETRNCPMREKKKKKKKKKKTDDPIILSLSLGRQHEKKSMRKRLTSSMRHTAGSLRNTGSSFRHVLSSPPMILYCTAFFFVVLSHNFLFTVFGRWGEEVWNLGPGDASLLAIAVGAAEVIGSCSATILAPYYEKRNTKFLLFHLTGFLCTACGLAFAWTGELSLPAGLLCVSLYYGFSEFRLLVAFAEASKAFRPPHATTSISCMWGCLFSARAVGVFVAGTIFDLLGFRYTAIVSTAPLILAAIFDEASRRAGSRE